MADVVNDRGIIRLMQCMGQELSKAEYPEVYAALGTQFSDQIPIRDVDGNLCMDNTAVLAWEEAGDTFYLPDLRGQSPT